MRNRTVIRLVSAVMNVVAAAANFYLSYTNGQIVGYIVGTVCLIGGLGCLALAYYGDRVIKRQKILGTFE